MMPVLTPAVEVAAGVLARYAGMRFDDGGAARLERCLTRLAQARQTTPAQLAARLAAEPQTLAALVDDLTIQESSFFRHPQQFDALARHVLLGLTDPVTVWSAGCANGQEAYSVAMLLAESGVADWCIVASDISRPALARTTAGRYAERELRGLDITRRHRHGRFAGDDWEVRPALRERVTAVHHRLAHDPAPVPPSSCQIVLCRNALIYLSAVDAGRFLARARDALAPGGWLLLGGAEALVHQADGLHASRLGDVYGYQRRVAAATTQPEAAPPRGDGAPATVGSLLQTGELAAGRGDHALAATAFRQAAAQEPGHPRAQLGLALSLEAAGDDAGALVAFRAAWHALDRADAATLADLLDGHDAGALVSLIADRLRESA